MSPQNDIDRLKNDVSILQNRVGGAEYLIKILIQKMHPNEVKAIENEINKNIEIFGSKSGPADILLESKRLLQK